MIAEPAVRIAVASDSARDLLSDKRLYFPIKPLTVRGKRCSYVNAS